MLPLFISFTNDIPRTNRHIDMDIVYNAPNNCGGFEKRKISNTYHTNEPNKKCKNVVNVTWERVEFIVIHYTDPECCTTYSFNFHHGKVLPQTKYKNKKVIHCYKIKLLVNNSMPVIKLNNMQCDSASQHHDDIAFFLIGMNRYFCCHTSSQEECLKQTEAQNTISHKKNNQQSEYMKDQY